MPRTLLARRVMDTIQELKQRASTLEAKGDDAGALKVYSAIPSDKLEAGLLGRMAAVQVRVGRPDDALRTHERAAAMLMNEGLNNAAIYAFRQLLQVRPDHREALLRLGQLSGEAGYRADAVAAFDSYLEVTGGEELDALVEVLENLPAEHGGAVAAELRDRVARHDEALADRIDRIVEGAGGASTGGAAGDFGLIAPAAAEPDEPEIAPLEGLETHGSDGGDLPPILGDLPLLDPLGGEVARGEADDEASSRVDPLPGMIPSLDDLDPLRGGEEDPETLAGAEEDADPAEDADEEGADALPLIGFEPSPSAAVPASAHASTVEEEAEAEDWVDLGAMVFGDEGEDGASTRAAGDDPGAAREDFSDLLSELGARPSEEAEDVGSHYDLGLAYKEMGLLDAAISQLHDALAAGDHPLASLEVLGECYLEQGDFPRACTALTRATELASSDSELLGVRYLLGRCEEAMGEKEAARESYGRVVAIEPGFRDAAERLGRL